MKAKILYDFKSDKVKKAFQLYALENNMTIQQMITDSLNSKFAKLLKEKIK